MTDKSEAYVIEIDSDNKYLDVRDFRGDTVIVKAMKPICDASPYASIGFFDCNIRELRLDVCGKKIISLSFCSTKIRDMELNNSPTPEIKLKLEGESEIGWLCNNRKNTHKKQNITIDVLGHSCINHLQVPTNCLSVADNSQVHGDEDVELLDKDGNFCGSWYPPHAEVYVDRSSKASVIDATKIRIDHPAIIQDDDAPLSYQDITFKTCVGGLRVYKCFNSCYVPPSNWDIKVGSLLVDPGYDDDTDQTCGAGINVCPSLDDAFFFNGLRYGDKSDPQSGKTIYELLIPWAFIGDIVIPDGFFSQTPGRGRKFRCRVAQITGIAWKGWDIDENLQYKGEQD